MQLEAKPENETTPPKERYLRLQKEKEKAAEEERNSTLENLRREKEETYKILINETSKMALDLKLRIPSAFS